MRRLPAVLYRDVLFEVVQPGTRWLDVGCGRSLLRPWLSESEADQRQLASRCSVVAGLDPADCHNPFLTESHIGDAASLPFEDNSFDLVTAQMVVEHLQEPERFISEAFRVLVPHGRLVIATPNLHNYLVLPASLLPSGLTRIVASKIEGRKMSDIFPTFYRLNTPGKIRKVTRSAGFQIESMAMLDGDSHLASFPLLRWLDSLALRLLALPFFAGIRSSMVAVFWKPDGRVAAGAPASE